MVNLIHNTLLKYFNKLYNVGYVNEKELNKVLFLICVYKVINEDFKNIITEEDYKYIGIALDNIFGTTCLLPYTDFCEYKAMSSFNLTDLTEIINRLTQVETDLTSIKTEKVIKKL